MHTLNPGYKFLTLLIISLMLSFTYIVNLNIGIFLCCMILTLMTPDIDKKKLALGLIPFFLTGLGLFVAGLFFSSDTASISSSWATASVNVESFESAMQLSTRVLAFGGIGIMFALTTKSEEFIMSLMQQFRLPPKFAYGILAAYHFFPVVADEYRIVKAAFKVRGIKTSPISKKFMIPMLVHAFERSESIAMAMESRGFTSSGERGVAFPIGVRTRDYVFGVFFIGVMIVALIIMP